MMLEMKWLFLYFLLDTSAGAMQPKLMMRQVFASEAECNELGSAIAREIGYEDNSLKSFSTCVPESAFQERGLKSTRLGKGA